jgi:hypothetical protein
MADEDGKRTGTLRTAYRGWVLAGFGSTAVAFELAIRNDECSVPALSQRSKDRTAKLHGRRATCWLAHNL